MFGNCTLAYRNWQQIIWEEHCKECPFSLTSISDEPCNSCDVWKVKSIV